MKKINIISIIACIFFTLLAYIWHVTIGKSDEKETEPGFFQKLKTEISSILHGW